VDRYRLEYEIKSNGLTEEEFCKKVGISRSALFRKKSGKTEFTLGEIKKIMDVLHLETANDIFFAK